MNVASGSSNVDQVRDRSGAQVHLTGFGSNKYRLDQARDLEVYPEGLRQKQPLKGQSRNSSAKMVEPVDLIRFHAIALIVLAVRVRVADVYPAYIRFNTRSRS